MKSTFATLTFLVATLAIVPRQSLGQYAWVPVYTDAAATEAYNAAPGQTGYATYVGEDLEASRISTAKREATATRAVARRIATVLAVAMPDG